MNDRYWVDRQNIEERNVIRRVGQQGQGMEMM